MREYTRQSYEWDSVEETPYFCRRCGTMKANCEGCQKTICRCDKNNKHIVGPVIYFCLGRFE